ncbi:MAG: hypothetical protein AB7O57_12280 [Hyphomicrobiaceae bacterium]
MPRNDTPAMRRLSVEELDQTAGGMLNNFRLQEVLSQYSQMMSMMSNLLRRHQAQSDAIINNIR